MGWKAVDLILSESTRKKIILTDQDTSPELTDNADAWMIEEQFGGSAPAASVFWPPILPDDTD